MLMDGRGMTRFDRSGGRRRALVTGGAGFVGSHVCDHLIAEGAEVVCVDNFQTGRPQNIRHLRNSPLFRLIAADIAQGLPEETFDEIWNLACPASPAVCQADPIGALTTSVLGARNCLELARATGARLLQASSGEVEGGISASDAADGGRLDPRSPRACYAEGKRAAESLCYAYASQQGAEIKVARIFSAYGPRMAPDDGRVVASFVVAALRGRPLALCGGGGQTRSFCYVGDLVDGLFRLMRAPPEVAGPIDLGDPAECAVRDLAALIVELTGASSPLLPAPPRPHDSRRRAPDITRALSELHWAPRVGLRQGLAATIHHFRQEIGCAATVVAA